MPEHTGEGEILPQEVLDDKDAEALATAEQALAEAAARSDYENEFGVLEDPTVSAMLTPAGVLLTILVPWSHTGDLTGILGRMDQRGQEQTENPEAVDQEAPPLG
jgi:hypothetical protein